MGKVDLEKILTESRIPVNIKDILMEHKIQERIYSLSDSYSSLDFRLGEWVTTLQINYCKEFSSDFFKSVKDITPYLNVWDIAERNLSFLKRCVPEMRGKFIRNLKRIEEKDFLTEEPDRGRLKSFIHLNYLIGFISNYHDKFEMNTELLDDEQFDILCYDIVTRQFYSNYTFQNPEIAYEFHACLFFMPPMRKFMEEHHIQEKTKRISSLFYSIDKTFWKIVDNAQKNYLRTLEDCTWKVERFRMDGANADDLAIDSLLEKRKRYLKERHDLFTCFEIAEQNALFVAGCSFKENLIRILNKKGLFFRELDFKSLESRESCSYEIINSVLYFVSQKCSIFEHMSKKERRLFFNSYLNEENDFDLFYYHPAGLEAFCSPDLDEHIEIFTYFSYDLDLVRGILRCNRGKDLIYPALKIFVEKSTHLEGYDQDKTRKMVKYLVENYTTFGMESSLVGDIFLDYYALFNESNFAEGTKIANNVLAGIEHNNEDYSKYYEEFTKLKNKIDLTPFGYSTFGALKILLKIYAHKRSAGLEDVLELIATVNNIPLERYNISLDDCFDFFLKTYMQKGSVYFRNVLNLATSEKCSSLREIVRCVEITDEVDSQPDIKVVDFIISSNMRYVYQVNDNDEYRVMKILKLPSEIKDSNLREKLECVIGVAEREWDALKRLSHDNIIRVWSHGNIGERAYIIEELVDGSSLKDYMSHTTFGNDREKENNFLKIFKSVKEGLAYLHKKGYIHRDIKPGNILVSPNLEIIKIDDLQTIIKADEAGLHRSDLYTRCMHGESYIAPELLNGDMASFSSDVYSLGLCMYEFLSGSLVPLQLKTTRVDRESYEKTLEKAINEVPSHYREALLNCLYYDPAQRFKSAAEIPHSLQIEAPSDYIIEHTTSFRNL